MPDAIFADRRLAAIYDPMDPDRGDLDAYLAMVEEFGARTVLDLGCGTGTFACLLAGAGIDVIGVDPAAASIEVARGKPHADGVRWIHGDATTMPPCRVDLVTMTANVAQVFITDEEWSATLRGIHDALGPRGRLVFETREPVKKAWLGWNREQRYARVHIPGTGVVESWVDLLDVRGELVEFRHTYVFESDGAILTSDSTLRFRGRSDIEKSLRDTGFQVDEVRDAPDRPGRELVFLAHRTH